MPQSDAWRKVPESDAWRKVPEGDAWRKVPESDVWSVERPLARVLIILNTYNN